MYANADVIQALGGTRVLKREVSNDNDLREIVRAGLPYACFRYVMQKLGLKSSEASVVVNLPMRTIARRKKEKKLRPDESDRLVRVARIGSIAESVLGSEAKAAAWLREPNRALGGVAPLEILDNDIGIKQVEEILGRIEYGVYS
jgi:putative toxin-antitoxin system antitoxin component (TIGR02293 family)